MRDFEEKITELRKIRRSLIGIEQSLQINMKQEEKEATKAIADKYLPQIKKATLNIIKSEEDMYKFNKKVVKCSTFERNAIIAIMRDIIRIYEGENFIYKNIRYSPDSNRRIKTERANILISDKRNDFIKDGIDISKLYSVQKNGDGIVLDWIEKDEYASFYQLTDDGELKTNIKLNKFPYLKQFIDFVISYCLSNENYIELDIEEDELENLKNEFIIANLDNIKKYHDMVRFNEQRKMEKEIEKNVEYRNKQLQKILNKKERM